MVLSIRSVAAPPAPFPIPPEFPVAWAHPDDARQHWKQEREHFPDPVTPLFFSMIDRMQGAGQRRVAVRYQDAVVARPCRRINTYVYAGLVPFDGPAPALAERERRSQEAIHAVMWQVDDVWAGEWLPELRRHHAAWDDFNLAAASLPALRAHLDDTLLRATRLWELHFLLAAPVWTALHEFEELYASLFPGAPVLAAHRLLQGFDNKTVELGHALWELGRQARAMPTVALALALPAPAVLAALDRTREGRGLLVALRRFLEIHGRRSSLWDWGYPSWIEDPAPVLATLRHALAGPDRDFDAEHAAAAAARDEAIAAARTRLGDAPPARAAQFERLLPIAQAALRISEDHNFYIDFSGMYRVRRVFGEFGRRFAHAGIIAAADDIFYLLLDEIQEAAVMRRPARLQARVATRRAEMARWARVTPPAELGTPRQADLHIGTPAARRQARLFLAPDTGPAAPGTIRGTAGAPGRARGRACVLRSLADAARLRRGDVLVTATTAPPWTPLFQTAAAVVTDTGGVLTHGAICAREYGIPAVVGTRHGTSCIADGQWVEVDGSAGIVYLLPDPPLPAAS